MIFYFFFLCSIFFFFFFFNDTATTEIYTLSLHDALPFFIERKGDRGPSRIDWIEVGGDAERLRTWLGGADLPVRMTPSPPAPARVIAMSVDGRELRS